MRDIRIQEQTVERVPNSANPGREHAAGGRQSQTHVLTGYEYWARDYPDKAWYGKDVERRVRNREEEE